MKIQPGDTFLIVCILLLTLNIMRYRESYVNAPPEPDTVYLNVMLGNTVV